MMTKQTPSTPVPSVEQIRASQATLARVRDLCIECATKVAALEGRGPSFAAVALLHGGVHLAQDTWSQDMLRDWFVNQIAALDRLPKTS